jgi:hypothetical protein
MFDNEHMARKLQSILEAARKRFRERRGIPHNVFWKEFATEKPNGNPKRSRTGKNSRTRR